VDVRIFSRKGQEDERAKLIEASMWPSSKKNLGDEIRILTDERLKRLDGILGQKEVLAICTNERTNKRLLTKGAILDRRHHRAHLYQEPEAHSATRQGPRVNEQIDEIER